MNERLRKLKEDRSKAIAEGRALLDKADAEKRGLTTEEQQNYDKNFEKVDQLRSSIEREERQIELDREMAGHEADEKRAGKSGLDKNLTRDELEMRGFNGRLLNGRGYEGVGSGEFRALQGGIDDAGGYLLTPQEFVKQLLKKIDDQAYMRQFATVLPATNATGFGIPTLDSDPSDADWTSELSTGNEDDSMKFGKRELKPHDLAKRIKISRKLLRNGALPVEQIVRDRLAYKFGITCEKAYLTGDGNNKPLGIFTASVDGISTARDVSAENAATKPTFNGLINAKYSLKEGYLKNSRWMFHRDAVKEISKIKDDDGQYIWQPSKKEGDPDIILGRPLIMSEYCPNTLTAGKYIGVIGDFSYYWIADSLLLQIQLLNELYAESNQVGLIGRLESDGMPVLEDAFARVQLG